MKKVQFLGEDCMITVTQYTGTKAPCIQLLDAEGLPMAKATVKLSEAPPKGCLFLKDYSENQGMAKAFTDAKLGEEIGRRSEGYVENGISIFRITDPELLQACYPAPKQGKQKKAPEPEI